MRLPGNVTARGRHRSRRLFRNPQSGICQFKAALSYRGNDPQAVSFFAMMSRLVMSIAISDRNPTSGTQNRRTLGWDAPARSCTMPVGGTTAGRLWEALA